jgi:hypothetical protein
MILSTDPTSLNYHLRELERQYSVQTAEADRIRREIARAAARGARKARKGDRRKGLIAAAIFAVFALACATAGGQAQVSASGEAARLLSQTRLN